MEGNTTGEWAAQILWVVGSQDAPAREPGSFRKALIQAAIKADPANLVKLAEAFPEMVVTLALWRLTGTDSLRVFAEALDA